MDKQQESHQQIWNLNSKMTTESEFRNGKWISSENHPLVEATEDFSGILRSNGLYDSARYTINSDFGILIEVFCLEYGQTFGNGFVYLIKLTMAGHRHIFNVRYISELIQVLQEITPTPISREVLNAIYFEETEKQMANLDRLLPAA